VSGGNSSFSAKWLRRAATIVVAASAALAPGVSRADGVNGYVELTASKARIETQDASGVSDEQSSASFLQRYSVNFSRRFWPNLYFRMGGLYERQDTQNEFSGFRLDAWRKRFVPYVLLSLRTPAFNAEVGYDRRVERNATDASVARLTQDTWRMNFGWKPVDLPQWRLELSRRNTYDYMREGLDLVQDRADLTSRYQALDKIDLYYRGSFDRSTDRVNDGQVTTNFQTARVSYGDAWRDRRLVFSADYTFNYRSTDTTRAGAGEVIFPVIPSAGLSSIDDTPEHDPLAVSPALIDGNRTTSAGINIGLPGVGGELRPRNIGLDLGFPQEVNTLLVWTDRELTPAIAAAFSWRVYTSLDNLDWTLHAMLPAAPFGPFENRFEVRFDDVTVRYVKVVVSPLSAVVPDATSWPDIEVTELAPEVRRPSSDLTARTSSVGSLLNTNFRARILDRPNLYYEFGYFLSTRSDGRTMWTLSNGLSVSHAISPILVGAARLSREDRQESLGRQTAYLFTGSLTANPIETVHESLVVTHVSEIGDFGRDTSSVVLTTAAQLYRGIGANLVLERTVILPTGGGRTDTKGADFGMSFVPHPTFTLNLSARERRSVTDFGNPTQPDFTDDIRSVELGAAYRPLRALYLFASQRWEQSEGSTARTLRNYSLSWTPFPDGTFHFNVYYASTYRTEFQESQQTLVPSIRWDITSKIFFDLTYQDLRTSSLLGSSRSKIGTATLRAAF
jgi:hypothetical protein